MFRRAASAALCLTAVLTLVASAQQAPPAQAPVFRSAVDLVHLDVSVLDRDRRPIRGLTADDFTVLEDGKPQPIVAFSAVDVPDPEPPPAPWTRRVSPDVQTNIGVQDREGRLFVLLLDDAMIPPHPASLETARDVARKFIDKVTPADRVAVVLSATGRNQNFTHDRAKLLAAIDSLQAGHASHLGGWESVWDLSEREAGRACGAGAVEWLITRKLLIRLTPRAPIGCVRRASARLPTDVDAVSAPLRKRAGLSSVSGRLALA